MEGLITKRIKNINVVHVGGARLSPLNKIPVSFIYSLNISINVRCTHIVQHKCWRVCRITLAFVCESTLMLGLHRIGTNLGPIYELKNCGLLRLLSSDRNWPSNKSDLRTHQGRLASSRPSHAIRKSIGVNSGPRTMTTARPSWYT